MFVTLSTSRPGVETTSRGSAGRFLLWPRVYQRLPGCYPLVFSSGLRDLKLRRVCVAGPPWADFEEYVPRSLLTSMHDYLLALPCISFFAPMRSLLDLRFLRLPF